MLDYLEHNKALGHNPKESLDQLVRKIARVEVADMKLRKRPTWFHLEEIKCPIGEAARRKSTSVCLHAGGIAGGQE